MVHGWYQSPFPHIRSSVRNPMSATIQHARRRQNEEGGYSEVPPGINESPDRFIGKPTIHKSTASSFSRLGLCALTI